MTTPLRGLVKGMGSSSNGNSEKGGVVSIDFSQHPHEEQNSKVQVIECGASASTRFRLTEKNNKNNLFTDFNEYYVLEADWADGKVLQAPVVPTGKDWFAELPCSHAGMATLMLRRKDDHSALTAPVLLKVTGGKLAGLALVSATPALNMVAAAKPAVVTINAVDEFGNQIPKSAGTLTATAVFESKNHDVQVQDIGDGEYSLKFSVPSAGKFQLQCSLKGHANLKMNLPGVSVAGPTDASQCVVEYMPVTIVAGKRSTFRMVRHDASGNRLTRDEPQAPLQIQVVSGPGTFESYSKDIGKGVVEIYVLAKKSGKYTFNVVPSGSLASKGSTGKHSVEVLPGKLSVEHTTAKLYCRGAEVTDRKAVAGQQLCVAIQANDEHGNPTKLDTGESFSVHALGAVEKNFAETRAPVKGVPESDVVYAATMTLAGLYALTVTYLPKGAMDPQSRKQDYAASEIGSVVHGKAPSVTGSLSARKPGTPAATKTKTSAAGKALNALMEAGTPVGSQINGWPKMLTVVSGAADGKQSIMSGSALAGVTCWEQCNITVHSVDDSGNLRVQGGDQVVATITHAKDKSKQLKPPVVDNGDGTYNVAFMLKDEGAYSFAASINGAFVERSSGSKQPRGELGVTLSAIHGDIEPSQCTLAGLTDVVCGKECKLMIQPVQWEDGRQMSGKEAVAVQVCQPSGVRRSIPTVVTSAGGRFGASVVWHEAGLHTAMVLLGGVPVKGSPFKIPVKPGDVDHRHCTLHGAALAGVSCWDVNEIALNVKDAHGNMRVDGDDTVVATVVYTEDTSIASVKAEVVNRGGGEYALQFKLMKEGLVALVVKVNGKEIQKGGSHFRASAGLLSAQACMVLLPKTPPVCGSPTVLYVQAALWHEGRVVGKDLPVTVEMVAPSGVKRIAEIEFNPAEGRFHALTTCDETGDHKVIARVGGVVVGTGPVLLTSVPGMLSLAKCEIDGEGARRCVAGDTTNFTLRARDGQGNRLKTGGATFKVEAICLDKFDAKKVTGTATDNGDGTYACSYRLIHCGKTEVTISAAGAGEPIVLEGVCVPGRTAAPKCVVTDWEQDVEADILGTLIVTRCDKHSNIIASGSNEAPLRATNTGPCPMELQVLEKGDGTVQINYRSKVAGSYSIHLSDSETSEEVAQSPFNVKVAPSTASVSESTWKVPSGKEMTGSSSRIVQAGQPVTVKVQVKDRFGNNCELQGGCEVILHGPVQQKLDLGEAKPKKPKAPTTPGPDMSTPPKPAKPTIGLLTFNGVLKVAGSYKVAVVFNHSDALPGAPTTKTPPKRQSVSAARAGKENQRTKEAAPFVIEGELVTGPVALLQVVPAAASEKACSLVGTALTSGVNSWQKFVLTLHTADAYGNDGTIGGDDITATFSGQSVTNKTQSKANVVDNKDGTYTLNCRLKGDGLWNLVVTVNGSNMDKPFRLESKTALMAAEDACVELPKRLVAGTSTPVYVQAVEFSLGRPMSGGENVSVRIVAPSGISASIPMDFDKKTARYAGTMEWVEAGAHSVSAMIEGALVSGCPKDKVVLPGVISLAKSQIDGEGYQKCVAGSSTMFTVNPVDIFGNTAPWNLLPGCNDEGFNPIQLVLIREGRKTKGEVKFNGDGTYLCTYTMKEAGPFSMVLRCSETGEERSNPTTCLPGRTAPEKCVTVTRKERLVAGELGSLSIQRKDFYRNDIERLSADEASFKVECSGPGTMKTKVMELGNGMVDVQHEATTAGKYEMMVTMGGVTVAESPYVVNIKPTQVSAAESSVAFGGGVDTSSEIPTVVAGASMVLNVSACDTFKNLSEMRGNDQVFLVKADGAEAVEFNADGTTPDGQLTYSSRLTKAGVYSVMVGLMDQKVVNVVSEDALQKSGESIRTPTKTPRTGNLSARGSVAGSVVSGRSSARGSPSGIRSGKSSPGPGSVAGSARSSQRSPLEPRSQFGGAAPSRTRSPSPGPGSVSGSVTARSTHSRTSSLGRTSTRTGRAGASKFHPDMSMMEPIVEQSPPVPLPGWPRRVQVVAGPCVEGKCTITCGDEGVARCWQPTTLTLHTADMYSNPCTKGGLSVAASLVAVGKGSRKVPVQVVDCHNGTYSLTCTPDAPGIWSVQVTIGETTVPATYKLEAQVSDCTAADCTALLNNGTGALTGVCGSSSTLYIQSLDSGGLGRKMSGKENVTVAVKPPNAMAQKAPVETKWGAAVKKAVDKAGVKAKLDIADALSLKPVQVEWNGKAGRFECKLEWVSAGAHMVWVALDDENIVGSPMTVQVGGGECAPKCCTVEGSALKGHAKSWNENMLLVTTADRFGTPCLHGGRKVMATITPDDPKLSSLSKKIAAKDNDDGTYIIPIMFKREGSWSLQVSVDGVELIETPAKVAVTRGRVYANQCVVGLAEPNNQQVDMFSGNTHLVCGTTMKVFTQPKLFDEGHFMAGDEGVSLRVVAPSGALTREKLNFEDGKRFSAPLQVLEVGRHELYVIVDGENVSGCPFILEATPGELSPSACSITGLDVVRSVGEPFEVEVTGRDEWGNRCLGLDTSNVSVGVEPNPDVLMHTMHKMADGMIIITITMRAVGTSFVSVHVNHLCLASRVPLTVVAGPLSLPQSMVTQAAGGEKIQATAGEKSLVILHARDKHGNAVHVGGATLRARMRREVATVKGSEAEVVEVQDCEDGTYHFKFKVNQAGPFSLLVEQDTDDGVESQKVDGMCVAGPTVTAKCTLADIPSQGFAGWLHKFQVERRDQHGNLVTRRACTSALTRFSAKGEGKGLVPLMVAVKDHAMFGSGEDDPINVEMEFTPHMMGTYTISVFDTTTKEKVSGSPFLITIGPGLPYAPCCTATMRRTSAEAVEQQPTASSWGRLLVKKAPSSKSTKTTSLRHIIPAGTNMTVEVRLRDKFGILASEAPEGTDEFRVLCCHMDSGETASLKQVGSSKHGLTFEGPLTKMGIHCVRLRAGGETARLPGQSNEIEVCAGPAVSARVHGLNQLKLMEFASLELPVMCLDEFGNEGATGAALVSIDHFLTMSSWVSSKDLKKRYALTDPLETGDKVRRANVELPMAGRWKVMVEVPAPKEVDPDTGEQKDKYKVIYEETIEVAEDPSIQ